MGKTKKHKRDKTDHEDDPVRKHKKERKEKKKHKKEKKRKRAEEAASEGRVRSSSRIALSPGRSSSKRATSPEASAGKRICQERLDRNSITSPSRELPSRSCAVKQKTSGGAGTLDKFLLYLLPVLEEKDVNCFFAMPVPDTFAPGYSKIIKTPMDFSTIRFKIEEGKYKTLEQFKNDFELICTNCMSYNGPETNYYKAAKKLLQLGEKILAEDRLRALAVHLPMMKDLSRTELGFELDNETPPPIMTPEDQRDMLANLGFLRTKPDGSTSLPILTPGDGVVPGTDRDRPVSLGSLIGKIKNGTGTLQGFREDRRNVAKSIHPLYYGAFSSHGPTYDSTFANLTKRETELVLGANSEDTLAAEKCVNQEDICFMSDHLLDILTNNQHRKESNYEEEERTHNSQAGGTNQNIDFESLKTLEDDGIDMSFLDNLAKTLDSKPQEDDEEEQVDNTPEGKLEKTAELISSLVAAQYERLSAPPPQHLSQIQPPSQKEIDIAVQVQESLADMAGQVKPSDISHLPAVRKAMGVSAAAKGATATVKGVGANVRVVAAVK